MRRNLDRLGLTWLGELDTSNIKELVVFGFIEIMGELIDTSDTERATEGLDYSLRLNFIACQVVVSDEILARLVHCKLQRELLSLQQL